LIFHVLSNLFYNMCTCIDALDYNHICFPAAQAVLPHNIAWAIIIRSKGFPILFGITANTSLSRNTWLLRLIKD